MRFIFFLLFSACLFGVDFDCIVIGSSPFSLFEALYQFHSGKSVLILEKEDTCGGAWKSIQVCGVPHVDLGCHQIGQDLQLKGFLEEYAGCKIVSLDNPLAPFEPTKSPNGFYFSKGCFELIDHLLKLISKTGIVLKTSQKMDDMSFDSLNKTATIYTKERFFTTHKLILTPMSCFGNDLTLHKSKYYHLYLLVQDSTPPKFTYQQGLSSHGFSRMVNLTHFTGLTNSGLQIIAIQTYNENYLANGNLFLDGMKAQGLIDQGATIIKQEPYIYEAGAFRNRYMGEPELIEVLQTGHFMNLTNYISKWKQILKPYDVVMRE